VSLLPQPVVATEALVLRAWPTGESSVIASLLTERAGYLRAIAKGARGGGSVLRALVQPGRLVAVECGAAAGRELQYLRGGSVLLDPLLGDNTLARTAYLLAALELADRSRPPEDRQPQLFALGRAFVQVLSCAARGAEARLFYRFELALLGVHGVSPVLAACAVCGAPASDGMDPDARAAAASGAAPGWRFSPAAGGAVCARCGSAGHARDGRELSAGGLGALRALAGEAAGAAGGAGEEEESTAWPGAPAGSPGDDGGGLEPWRREVGVLLHLFLGYHLPGYRLPAGLELLRPARPGGGTAGGSGPPPARAARARPPAP
jgi:DNA repair protein RecO (recombination protein O)